MGISVTFCLLLALHTPKRYLKDLSENFHTFLSNINQIKSINPTTILLYLVL